ncbi:uncharacterized protein Dvir_GJ26066 [Drosophila virilis]|uniref:Uncharacterized protein n=1 Tax=Drosophila virilis TaxID=7244 RepID=A0A0Q9WJZ1_DROVI|nr:uncharacterized protein Dvir_GJ26066 [Drosophila virilis]
MTSNATAKGAQSQHQVEAACSQRRTASTATEVWARHTSKVNPNTLSICQKHDYPDSRYLQV